MIFSPSLFTNSVRHYIINYIIEMCIMVILCVCIYDNFIIISLNNEVHWTEI